MQIEVIKVGFLQTNCYLLTIDNTCLIIDPGAEYRKIQEIIGDRVVLGVIVTHHHFDHVGALKHFNHVYDIHNLKEGINHIGKFSFEVIYTPGHTSDSICLYFKKENIMFVGDSIFKDAIGRTDIGRNDLDLNHSLTKMLNYDENIIIYPGHGDKAILGQELHKWI